MKIILDYDKCIGCGLCFMLKSDVFTLDDDGYCKLKKTEITENDLPKVKEVINVCPTKVIELKKDPEV